MSKGEPDHLFVYGTLMSGGKSPYARLLQRRARFVGEGSTSGRLYHLGAFPAAVFDESSKGKVFGEVYRLKGKVLLLALDRYEGCHEQGGGRESLFRRTIIEARFATGSLVRAWAYSFIGNVHGRPVISSGRFRAASI